MDPLGHGRAQNDGQTEQAGYWTLSPFCLFPLRKLGYARPGLRPDYALLPSAPEPSCFFSSYIVTYLNPPIYLATTQPV